MVYGSFAHIYCYIAPILTRGTMGGCERYSPRWPESHKICSHSSVILSILSILDGPNSGDKCSSQN